MKRDKAEILLILILSLILTDQLVTCGGMQMYDVSQVNVINSPGDAVVSAFTLIGRNRALNGTITLLEDLTDSFQLTIKLYSDPLGVGDYKLMPMELPPNGVCTTLRDYYTRFIKGSIDTGKHTDFDFKDGTACPLSKGKYWMKNVIFDTKGWVNILPRGVIKAELKILKRNRFVGGFSIVVSIENII